MAVRICAKLQRLLSKGEISKGKSLLLNREDSDIRWWIGLRIRDLHIFDEDNNILSMLILCLYKKERY